MAEPGSASDLWVADLRQRRPAVQGVRPRGPTPAEIHLRKRNTLDPGRVSDSHVESLTTDPLSGGPVIQRRSMELFRQRAATEPKPWAEAAEELQKKELQKKVATRSTNDSMSHGDEIDEGFFGNEEIEIVGEQWPSPGEEDEELTPSKRLPPGDEEEAVLLSIESERKRKAALAHLKNQDEMNLQKALRASVKEMSAEEGEPEYALSESRKETFGRLNFGGSSSSASSGPPSIIVALEDDSQEAAA